MGPDDISAERLGHGYAITAHRSQGSTVDVAHVLDDGGGRELAYVAMSRARTASHIYVTAPDPDHAAQRLAWGWDQQRRQQWITHRHQTAARTAARIAELTAERDRLAALDPARRHRPTHPRPPPDRPDRSRPGRPARRDRPLGRHPRPPRPPSPPTTPSAPMTTTSLRAHDRYLGLVGPTPSPPSRTSQQHRPSPKPKPPGRKPSDPTTTNSPSSKTGSASEARKLEAAQQTRTDFLAAHPEIVDRISQLDHAITQQPPTPGPANPTTHPVAHGPPSSPASRHDPHLEYIHHQQIAEAVHAPQIGGPGI